MGLPHIDPAVDADAGSSTRGADVRIDCDECVMQHTSACDDCIVTALIDRPVQGAVVLDLDHERAIRRLQDEGLAPRSRFQGRDRPLDSGDGARATGG